MGEYLDREELAQLQRLVEAEHGHPLDYAIRRHFFGVVPVFLVDDIQATCDYYEKVLGFSVAFTFGEPADFASVFRNNAVIHLNQAEPAGSRNSVSAGGATSASDAYFIVNDVDELCEELRDAGATIRLEPVRQDNGMRECQVEDCNGYRLTLAEGLFREH